MTRVVRLAFLSPAVVDALIKGRQSVIATLSELTLGSGIEPHWGTQESILIAAR